MSHDDTAPPPATQRLSLGRREMLKSATALLAASTSAIALADAQTTLTPRDDDDTSRSPVPPPLRKGMISFTLSHEQFPVPELARLGPAAELAGFDVLATSDHLQPWQDDQKHAGQAWVTLATIAARTRHVWMGTAVTCPTLRYTRLW
jgi:Luciferase-like monooxygenase